MAAAAPAEEAPVEAPADPVPTAEESAVAAGEAAPAVAPAEGAFTMVDAAGGPFYYQPWESSDEPEAAYTRRIPSNAKFDGDLFLKSMYKTYALEEKNCDEEDANCVPSGRFWMNPSGTRTAAKEVLATSLKLTGEAQKEYLDQYFDKAWAHFDVNQSGVLETTKMPAFFRFLMSDQFMDIGQIFAGGGVREPVKVQGASGDSGKIFNAEFDSKAGSHLSDMFA